MPPELQLLVIVVALLGFWAIVMRPTRIQQRRVAELQSALAVGDEVILSAGIFGTVVAVEEDRVQLQVAPGTVLTVARQVVVRRAPEAEQAAGRADHVETPAAETPHTSTTEDIEEKQDRG